MTTLTARNISWLRKTHRILNNVSIEANVGEKLGILGPNGAGKTSLLRILAGLRVPTSGTVLLDHEPLLRIPRQHVARRLAIVEQTVEVHEDITVQETVALGRTPYRGAFNPLDGDDRQAVEQALELTGLTRLRTRSWRTLSGGEQQRAQLARALAQQPGVVILDEPTNHLDIRYQLDMIELLSHTELTVVTALHDLNLAARFCDRVAVMHNGSIHTAGPPSLVLTTALIDDVYGVTSAVEQSPHTDTPVATFLAVNRERAACGSTRRNSRLLDAPDRHARRPQRHPGKPERESADRKRYIQEVGEAGFEFSGPHPHNAAASDGSSAD